MGNIIDEYDKVVQECVRFHKEHKSIHQLEKADLEGATCKRRHVDWKGQFFILLTLKNGTQYLLDDIQMSIILTTYFDGK